MSQRLLTGTSLVKSIICGAIIILILADIHVSVISDCTAELSRFAISPSIS